MAFLVTVASPPAAIVRLSTLALPSTATQEVVEVQTIPRKAVAPSTLVAFQPVVSFNPASLTATCTLPVLSTTAHHPAERHEAAFIDPVPMLSAVQEAPLGLAV